MPALQFLQPIREAIEKKRELSGAMAEKLLEDAWDWRDRAQYYLRVFELMADATKKPGVFSYLDCCPEDVPEDERPLF